MRKQACFKSCTVFCILGAVGILILRAYDSKEETRDNNGGSVELRDKTWRRTNHIITQYRPDIEERLISLASRKAPQDDTEVIQLARDVIDPEPATAAVGIKASSAITKTPQAAEVEKITNGTVNRQHVDCICMYSHIVMRYFWEVRSK
jgi:hypothetical protein